MLKNSFAVFLGAYLFLTFINPKVEAKTKPVAKSLHNSMSKVASLLNELFLHLSSEESFQEEKFKQALPQKLKEMKQHLSDAEPHFARKGVYTLNTHTLLLDHLDQTLLALDRGAYKYARQMSAQLQQYCLSCHIKDQQERQLFVDKGRKNFKSDRDYASFLMATRDYSKARLYLQKFYQQAQAKLDSKEREQALKQLLALSLMTQGPSEAKKDLIVLSQENKLSPMEDHLVKGWIEGLDLWINDLKTTREQVQGFEKEREQKLENFLQNNGSLSPQEQIQLLRWHLELWQKVYYQDPSADYAQWLYQLAVIEKKLEHQFVPSMANLYLRQCMEASTDSVLSEKCFKEYYRHIKSYFQAESTFEWPKDAQSALKRWVDKFPQIKIEKWDQNSY